MSVIMASLRRTTNTICGVVESHQVEVKQVSSGAMLGSALAFPGFYQTPHEGGFVYYASISIYVLCTVVFIWTHRIEMTEKALYTILAMSVTGNAMFFIPSRVLHHLVPYIPFVESLIILTAVWLAPRTPSFLASRVLSDHNSRIPTGYTQEWINSHLAWNPIEVAHMGSPFNEERIPRIPSSIGSISTDEHGVAHNDSIGSSRCSSEHNTDLFLW